MSVRLKAIYRDGAFVPLTNGEKLNVPENSEVELTVHNPSVLPARPTSGEDRQRALRELFASWDAYPLRPDAPRLTRDEMHERR
jgi:antitoxin component of MazEF toxin-antitoxin module